MKHEWRKSEKHLYLPKTVESVTVPPMKFITVAGQGNPNDADFGTHITALYSVAYGIRMDLKKGAGAGVGAGAGTSATGAVGVRTDATAGADDAAGATEPYEYTVYPLEGVWTTTDGSRGAELNKEALAYTLMLRQPEQTTRALFDRAVERAEAKKPNPYLGQLAFEEYEEGAAVQAIHTGSFDTESETFAQLQSYLDAHGLTRLPIIGEYWHREIYLSDFRRVPPDRRKTLLRYRVQ